MKYRILTLDGGGVWALIEGQGSNPHFRRCDARQRGASAIRPGSRQFRRQHRFGRPGRGQELLNYFMDPVNRNAIFSPTSSVFDRTLEGLLDFGPKYSAAAKLPVLETLLPQTGNVKLQGINNNLAGYNGTMYETAVAQIVLSSQNRIPVLAAQHVGNGGTLSLNERRDVIAALLAEPISPALTDKVRSI